MPSKVGSVRVYLSDRDLPLTYTGPVPDRTPILTMELAGKWYNAYSIQLDGSVRREPFDPDNNEDEYDHVPTPEACHRMAHRLGYDWCSLSLNMIAGRFVEEIENRMDWVVDRDCPFPQFENGRLKKVNAP